MGWPALEMFSRLILAYTLMLLLIVLNAVSFALPYAGSFQPSFVLMGIYFWSLYRPLLFPPFVIFLAGIILDALLGLPLGINALTLLGVHWVVRSQRRFLTGQVFLIQWLVFLLIVLATAMFQWLVIAFSGQGFVPVVPPLLQGLSTALLYPVVIFPLFAVHRLLPLPRKIVS